MAAIRTANRTAASPAAALLAAALLAACSTASGTGAPAGAEGAARAPSTAAAPVRTAPSTSTTVPPTTTTTVAPCPVVAGVDGDVTVFRAGDGGRCVDPRRLVAYRCDDGSVPAIVTADGGPPVDHLGGRFAATVPAAPGDAVVLGVRDDGATVARSPADPGAVYLDTGVAVTRWPALGRFTTGSGAVVAGFFRPHAFFLGDSVMLGAVGAIQAAMAPWDVTVDAAVSRSTAAALDVLRARRGEVQDVVVLQLGANDGGDPGVFAGRVRAVMDELAGVPLVVWLTIREARPYYAAANAALRDVVAGYPNGMVADWNAVAPPTGVYRDGLHLAPEGAAAMAALARDTVFLWYAGTADRGPDPCRADLDAALAARR